MRTTTTSAAPPQGQAHRPLRFHPGFAIRGAISTGFLRTPGQSNVSQITTAFQGTGLVDIATLPPTNPIAELKARGR